MKKTLFLLTLCSLLLAASCNSDDDATPDTSNDHDTLRCKINGQDWTPAGGDLFTTKPYDLRYYSEDNRLGLTAFRGTEFDSGGQSIDIDCTVESIGVLNPMIAIGGEFRYRLNSSSCIFYDVDTLNANYIKVSFLDTVNFVMIGEFAFNAINECNDTVYITDGYFDLNYKF